MAAISRASGTRSLLDAQDLDHCKTTTTGAGVIFSGIVTACSLMANNKSMAALGAVTFLCSWMGHHSARDCRDRDSMVTTAHALSDLVNRKNEHLSAKEKLIQEQKAETEHLKEINSKLEAKVKALGIAQKSFDQLNEEHLQMIEKQREQLEQGKGALAKMEGTLSAYEDRKLKFLEEIRQAKQDREKLEQDISSLLREQKRINEELAQRVIALGEVADRMSGAAK